MEKYCPNCKEPYNYLKHYQDVNVSWIASIEEDGSIAYDNMILDEPKPETIEYRCPGCNHLITTDEEKAIVFLKNQR